MIIYALLEFILILAFYPASDNRLQVETRLSCCKKYVVEHKSGEGGHLF